MILFLTAIILAILVFPNRAVESYTAEKDKVVLGPIEWNFDKFVTYFADKYKQDEDLARRIIWCESRNNKDAIGYNYNKEGLIWSKDISYWQINNYWHEEDAKKLGYDINEWVEGLEYGFIILKRDGSIKHWRASVNCWDKE